MKKALLCVLAIIAVMFITCGNEPPEEFYDGTPADDSAIGRLLDSVPQLYLTEDIFVDSTIGITMTMVRFLQSDLFFKNDSVCIKHQVDSLSNTLTTRDSFVDYWYAKDTTCTVYMWDTFTFVMDAHYSFRYLGYYFVDSIGNPDTTESLTYVKTDSTPGWYSYTGVTGEGLRHVFLEPQREWVVDDETGDSVLAVAEPRVWQIKRISYGNYYFPNSGADIPVINNVVLRSKLTQEWDTVYALNYDTLFTGNAMNRFKAIDSLLEYDNGDTLYIDITLGGTTIVDSFCLFFASANGVKLQLSSAGQGYLPITGSGITNLVFSVFHEDGLYYVKPVSTFAARFWLVPIRVR